MSKETVLSNRIAYIDTARVISMLWIVGYWHLIQYSGKGYIEKYTFEGEEYITMSMLGLFMFLSGYLLGRKKLDSKENVVTFYKRRFWRFYFLYAVSALALFGMGFIENVPLLITTLTATSSFILPQPNTLWFMSMLAFFYLVTPIAKKNYILGGGIFLLIILFNYIIPEGVDPRLFIYYPIYTCGLYLAETDIVVKMMNKRVTVVLSLALSIVLFFFPLEWDWILYLFILPVMIFILSFSRLIDTQTTSLLVSFLAYSSLCAYLFHREIYILISTFFDRLGLTHPLWVCLVVMIPICMIASYIIQKLYDIALKKLNP